MAQVTIGDFSITTLAACLVGLGFSTIIYRKVVTEYQKYAALKALPGPPPNSLLAGNLDTFFDPKKSVAWHGELTEKYGSAVRLTGTFGEPQVFLSDPKGLDTVLLKQGEHFTKPDFLVNVHGGCFGEGPAAVEGAQHRKQRKRIIPALTPAASKAMAYKFATIAFQLRNVFKKQISRSKNGQVEADVRRWMGRAALEVAVQDLGHTFDLINDEKEIHPYSLAAVKLFQCVTQIPPVLIVLFHPFTKIGTPAVRQFLTSLLPLDVIPELKRVLNVFDATANQIYKHAQQVIEVEKAPWKLENERSPSLITQILKESKQESDQLSHDEAIGMITALIFGAHDTTATAMTRCLQVFAERPDIQKRVRAEVRGMFADEGNFNLDRLMDLPILDAFIKEVLRVYAPLPSMPRVARKEVTIPLFHPITATDGVTQLHELHVKAGTTVQVAMAESNLNTKTWGPDAREFKLERWLEPLPDSVTNAGIPGLGIYSTLMTFINGSRSCLGMRFAIYEMKTVIGALVDAFEFKLDPNSKVSWLNYVVEAPHVEGDPDLVNRFPMLVSLAPEDDN
ncbi:cytochrome P450 [Schizopora paradoxa]|uniref:Cytochrome P450 n=1 Tax=Schizopora paradoxa TaxID=27342 RepID=A0A0H2RC66_9AGAM|nr:cytochrome P450 [Schizopora paradoxa]